MLESTLVEDLRRELLRLRDDRIRLDAELKAKSEMLRRLIATEGSIVSEAKAAPQLALDLTWAEAILMCVKDLGGKASLRQIYADIAKYRPLSAEHNKQTVWGRRPAFQHEVRSFISGLVLSEKLRWVSRGVYEITQQGEDELALAGREPQMLEALAALSAETDPALAEIWSHPQDAAYDEL